VVPRRHNLLVDRNADARIALIERAGKARYNGIILADYKFNLLGGMPPQDFANARRVRRPADPARRRGRPPDHFPG
jgi:hypothetical protein